jgi:hypothetical protein
MFWLFNFLSDLTSQKNNFMISQKIIKLVGHAQIDLIDFWSSFPIK